MSNETRVNRGEINRLNRAISAEEQTINSIFQRMGQTYFAAHRDDPEESQAVYVQGVLEAMNRAKGYKDQINVLRGIAICPNCKAEVSSTAAFCSRCGTRMPGQAQPMPPVSNALHCPNCGNACQPGTRFCNRCGTRLPEAAAPAEAARPAPIPQPAAPTAVPQPVAPTAIPQPAAPTAVPQPVTPTAVPQPTAPSPEPASVPAPEPTAAFPDFPPESPEPAPQSVSIPIPEPTVIFNEFPPEPPQMPTAIPEPEQSFPAPAPAPAAPTKRICPHCGTELDPEFRFCLECGNPV